MGGKSEKWRKKFSNVVLIRFRNFMTCSEHFKVKSEGSISQLWNIV